MSRYGDNIKRAGLSIESLVQGPELIASISTPANLWGIKIAYGGVIKH